jgi:hypothetical protein
MTDEQLVEFLESGNAMGSPIEVMLDGMFGKVSGKFVGAYITHDEEGNVFADCTVEDSTGKRWAVHHRHLVPVRS